MTPGWSIGLVSGGCLAASVVGLLTRRRAVFLARELLLLLASLGVGFAVQRDWLPALSIATLPYGAYHAFLAWRPNDAQNKQAFHFAFFGAAWFLLMTVHDYQATVAAAVLSFYGPVAARWVTARTRDSMGLLIIAGAVLFQLERALWLL